MNLLAKETYEDILKVLDEKTKKIDKVLQKTDDRIREGMSGRATGDGVKETGSLNWTDIKE